MEQIDALPNVLCYVVRSFCCCELHAPLSFTPHGHQYRMVRGGVVPSTRVNNTGYTGNRTSLHTDTITLACCAVIEFLTSNTPNKEVGGYSEISSHFNYALFWHYCLHGNDTKWYGLLAYRPAAVVNDPSDALPSHS